VRDYARQKGVGDEEAVAVGMEEKAAEFRRRPEIYTPVEQQG